MAGGREHEIVLFGATGFTGSLTARYLAEHAPAGLRWAVAGRDTTALSALATELSRAVPSAGAVAVSRADVTEESSMRALAESARLVATTVGPFLRYGATLVRSCARAGTDYVDITGEPEFVDRTWLDCADTAAGNGARLVHCCGFDSVPHDLGVWWTLRHLPAGVPLRVAGYVRARGGMSAGTIHSAVLTLGRARQMAAAARERHRREARPEGRQVGSLPARPHREPVSGRWAVPLPTIDPVVVRRSARALPRYGPDFRYGHYAVVGGLPAVAGAAVGAGALVSLARLPPTRAVLLRLGTPGNGPSDRRRAQSWFRVRFLGSAPTEEAPQVVTEIAGGDPGYDETATMLAESALCLVRDELPRLSGQLTPAQAMGDALVTRLQRAGITFRRLPAEQVAQ